MQQQIPCGDDNQNSKNNCNSKMQQQIPCGDDNQNSKNNRNC